MGTELSLDELVTVRYELAKAISEKVSDVETDTLNRVRDIVQKRIDTGVACPKGKSKFEGETGKRCTRWFSWYREDGSSALSLYFTVASADSSMGIELCTVVNNKMIDKNARAGERPKLMAPNVDGVETDNWVEDGNVFVVLPLSWAKRESWEEYLSPAVNEFLRFLASLDHLA